jgi:hypothetical protein
VVKNQLRRLNEWQSMIKVLYGNRDTSRVYGHSLGMTKSSSSKNSNMLISSVGIGRGGWPTHELIKVSEMSWELSEGEPTMQDGICQPSFYDKSPRTSFLGNHNLLAPHNCGSEAIVHRYTSYCLKTRSTELIKPVVEQRY